jgi:hypothetical protein
MHLRLTTTKTTLLLCKQSKQAGSPEGLGIQRDSAADGPTEIVVVFFIHVGCTVQPCLLSICSS